MRHYKKRIGVTRRNHSPLLQEIFRILDCRIQYIDYQIQRYFDTCMNGESVSDSATPLNNSIPSMAKSLVQNLDNLLEYIDSLQANLKLLQILRTWLQEKTVQNILYLLDDNKYLNFSEQELEEGLKKQISFINREVAMPVQFPA